jgi:hypothetical protein
MLPERNARITTDGNPGEYGKGNDRRQDTSGLLDARRFSSSFRTETRLPEVRCPSPLVIAAVGFEAHRRKTGK